MVWALDLTQPLGYCVDSDRYHFLLLTYGTFSSKFINALNQTIDRLADIPLLKFKWSSTPCHVISSILKTLTLLFVDKTDAMNLVRHFAHLSWKILMMRCRCLKFLLVSNVHVCLSVYWLNDILILPVVGLWVSFSLFLCHHWPHKNSVICSTRMYRGLYEYDNKVVSYVHIF